MCLYDLSQVFFCVIPSQSPVIFAIHPHYCLLTPSHLPIFLSLHPVSIVIAKKPMVEEIIGP